MMGKQNIILLLLLLGMLQAVAQQDPQFSTYMFNPMAVNPAYAGSRNVMSAVLVQRSQWIGIKGAPETQTLAVHSPLKNKKMGVGLQLINDKIGARNTQNITAVYAYRIRLGLGKLAFGLKAGFINYHVNIDEIKFRDNNLSFPSETQSVLKPTFDFGVYYNTNTYYAGLTVEHLNHIQNNSVASTVGINNANISNTHVSFIGTAGKAFKINRDLMLKASTLIRVIDGVQNVDLNTGVLIKHKIFFGLSYRSSNALVLITEINISKSLRAGFGYDVDRLNWATSTAGTLEFFVGYDLKKRKTTRVSSPRYF